LKEVDINFVEMLIYSTIFIDYSDRSLSLIFDDFMFLGTDNSVNDLKLWVRLPSMNKIQ
jgi:hypothetical protein